MSYNGSGLFQINTSGQPVVAGTVITASAFNALTADLATGLTTAITKDGQTATTAQIPFAQGLRSTLVTDSTNSTSGSIITDGGLGVAKAVNIGTTLGVTGAVTGSSTITGTKLIPTGTSVTGNGMYLPATNTLGFSTNGTNAVTIDASQNVGVGVTPSAWPSGQGAMQLKNGGLSAWALGGVNGYIYSNAYYDGSNNRYINNGFANSYAINNANGIHAWFTAPSGTAGNTISFTQAMTLDASSILNIGNTTNAVAGGVAIIPNSNNSLIRVGHIAGSGNSSYYANFFYDSSQIGSITQSGTTAVLFNTTSDQRLKENIEDAASASDLIDSLQVRQFDWKTDNSHQRYGFVAQELVTVAPEAVHQPADPDDMMAVDYSKLVPMLVKEIQSLRKRLAALENK